MANRANTSIAHVLRRALARKFFGALCGTHVLERYDELIAPLSVDMYELKYTGVGACVVRAYRFSDGSVLEVHCAGMGVASLHDYDPVGLARLIDKENCTDVIEVLERRFGKEDKK